jgi:acetyl esterase/lipase
LAAAFTLVLTGCSPEAGQVQPAAASPQEQVLIYSDVTVTEDLPYGAGAAQRLDVCQPADPETSSLNNGPRRAIVSVHGGSWREGDKASPHWRSACEWLASEGFVAFSVNYALAPANPYPAAITDVQAVVSWLRQQAQVDAYDYDPALIGAFGGSAGGNLVTLLGASGSGDWATGTRVAAVVELSAPIDLSERTTAGYPSDFVRHQLEYLGCEGYGQCESARSASPHHAIDPSDPPVFIAHSAAEFVPVNQARTLISALKAHGIAHQYVEVPGDAHSLALLDDALRLQIVEFLRARL